MEALWPILETSERMRDVFGSRPIVSYKRPKNLKDSLIRSKVKKAREVNVGMSKCIIRVVVRFVIMWMRGNNFLREK